MTEELIFTNFEPVNVHLKGRHLIQASAGTGKTYSLMHLVLRLLVEGVERGSDGKDVGIVRADKPSINLPRILLVTFSRAATSEIKTRLHEKIKQVVTVLEESGTVTQQCRLFNDPVMDNQIDKWLSKNPGCLALIKQRLNDALVVIDKASVFTIHGFCQHMMTSKSFTVGAENAFELGDDGSLRLEVIDEFWRKKAKEYSGQDKVFKKLLEADWNANLQALARLSQEARATVCEIKPDENDPESLTQDECNLANNLVKEFKKEAPESLIEAKERIGLVTYDDLIAKMAETVGKNSAFAKSVSNEYDAVLIDEFQDTDRLQYQIFKKLFLDCTDEKSVFFVGDPKQAIYAFRGAELQAYVHARYEINEFGKATGRSTLFKLPKNFRSAPSIIAGVNAFYTQAQDGAKTLETEKNNPDLTKSAFLTDAIQYENVEADEKKLPLLKKDDTDLVPVPSFEVWYNKDKEYVKGETETIWHQPEADLIANDIARLLNDEVYVGGKRRLKPSDIAILVRAHAHADLVKEALTKRGIGYVDESGDEDVFQTDEAKEILTVLKSIQSPSDQALLTAARATVMMGRVLQDFKRETGDNGNQTELLEDRTLIQKCLEHFALRQVAGTFSVIFQQRKTVKNLLNSLEGERRLTNYAHIIEILQDKYRELKSLSALIRFMERELSHKDDNRRIRPERDGDLVRIGTIHFSKGLEFPVVYLAGTSRRYLNRAGNSPVLDIPDPKDEKGEKHQMFFQMQNDMIPENQKTALGLLARQESIRLAYVAMTRASARMVLSLFHVCTKKGDWYSYSASTPYFSALSGLEKCSTPSKTFETLEARLKDLNKDDGALLVTKPIDYDEVTSESKVVTLESKAEEKAKLNLEPMEPHPCARDWIQTSFSMMSKGIELEGPAADESLTEDNEDVSDEVPIYEDNGLLFGSSANFGDFVHNILERIPYKSFTGFSPEDKSQLVSQLFTSLRGIQKPAASQVKNIVDLVDTVLDIPVLKKAGKDLEDFRLSSLEEAERSAELDFMLFNSAENISAKTIGEKLATMGERYQGLTGLQDNNLHGYLNGQIDLVFKAHGKYWVIDWKTNNLNRKGGYSTEALEREMIEAHYNLQYLIYLVALTRLIAVRHQSSFEDAYSMVGGAAYVFLRGIKPGTDNSIYFDRPDVELMKMLNDLLVQAEGQA